MKATQLLHNLGQSLWLDNITRDLLDSGTLSRYIQELSVTGLTSIRPSSTTPSKTAGLRRRDPPEAEARQIGRGAFLRAGAGRPHPGRRSVPADSRPD